jgi:chromosome segregation ATPase
MLSIRPGQSITQPGLRMKVNQVQPDNTMSRQQVAMEALNPGTPKIPTTFCTALKQSLCQLVPGRIAAMWMKVSDNSPSLAPIANNVKATSKNIAQPSASTTEACAETVIEHAQNGTSNTASDNTLASDHSLTATREIEDLQHSLEEKNGQIDAVWARHDQVVTELQTSELRYASLERKYQAQLEARKNDYQKVNEAYECYEAVVEECAELKEKLEVQQTEHQKSTEKYNGQLQDKDDDIALMEESHERAIAELEEIHREVLSAKDDKLAKVKKGASKELRRVVKDCDNLRKAWEAGKRDLEAELDRMNADANDAHRAQRDEIQRLIKVKDCLADQVTLLSGPANGREEVRLDLEEDLQSKQRENDELRMRNSILEEKIENILYAADQNRVAYLADETRETQARSQACDLQKKVEQLEEKLANRDEVIRQLDQREGRRDSETLDQSSSQGDGLGQVSGAMVVLQTEEFRKRLDLIQQEKKDVEAKANKVDDENLALLMQIANIQNKYEEQTTELKDLRYFKRSITTELEVLDNAENQDDLRRHLRETGEDNRALMEAMAEMERELNQHREFIKTVEDKASTEIMKANATADIYSTLYYDEAVGRVERLYEEIYQLNTKLGRDVRPKDQIVRNKRVEDRAALRTACKEGMDGVVADNIPKEYYEPGFQPGHVPATYDAMRVLRPLGWLPLYKRDRVYLQPMYKPFTEADSEARAQAKEYMREEMRREELREGMLLTEPCLRYQSDPYLAEEAEQQEESVQEPATPTAMRVARPLPTPPATPPTSTRSPPPYESRFAAYNGMSEELYNELEDENKWDFIHFFVKE